MKRFILTILFSTTLLCAHAQIIFSDYSDPDVCQSADGNLWMTASSFQCTPGLPLLHSTDGNTWELIGYALNRLYPTDHYDSIQHGCGVWAPSIREHNHTYYIFWGDPDYGIFMIHATDPLGKWSEPTLVVEGKGLIDPCPLWTDDGRCFLVNAWAASRCGFNSVLTIRELSADGSKAISSPVLVYDGQQQGNHTIEGPKLYQRDGYFYILAPAGGVEQGWQLALRSKNIYGPWESKIVFNQNGIHQGGLVGNKFYAFQDRGPYGRVIHRLDVQWKNGWPMMSYNPQENKPQRLKSRVTSSCNVLVESLLPYQWHANYQEEFGFPTSTGMRIYGHRHADANQNLWHVPNLYLRKFDGEEFSDTLKLRITANAEGQQSGFVIMGRDYCRLSVELINEQLVLKQIICHDADKDGHEETIFTKNIKAHRYNAGALDNFETSLHVILQCNKNAICTISYSTDGKHFTTLPQTFAARVGKWIGAKYGLFSTTTTKQRGFIDFLAK